MLTLSLGFGSLVGTLQWRLLSVFPLVLNNNILPLGTPIAGALLTSRYLWWRPIVFDGVRLLSSSWIDFARTEVSLQVICAIGVVLFLASRHILIRRKGSGWAI